MEPVGVREATGDDAATLEQLRAAARAAITAGRGGPLLLADLDDDPAGADGALTLVGLVGEAPVGYAALAQRGDRVRIRELWVDPGARGVGVGRALLAAVAAEARRRGASVLESQVLPGDRAAKNFFEAEGMVSRLLVVSRPLRGDA